jgi:hypothetical protein
LECLIQWQIVQDGGKGDPSDIDGTSNTCWHDVGSAMCENFADSGGTDVLTDPLWAGAGLGNNYDPTCEYLIGQPNRVRQGTRETLQRFAAIAKANGLGMHDDLVAAHRDGPRTHKSPSGQLMPFPKDKNCFVNPDVPKDNVAVPSEDFASFFGEQVSHYSGYYGDGTGDNGRGYPRRQLTKALDWLFSALDLQGVRWDNVKSLDPSLIRDVCNAAGAQHKMWGVGEFWSSNVDQLMWYIFGSNTEQNTSLFDFPLAFEIRNFCNNAARYNMAKLQYTGLYQRAPYKTVKYVNSHDIDKSANRVVFNMLLGYALIMTTEGVPCIYAKDWLHTYGGYGLSGKLANLLWIRRFLAQGTTTWLHSGYNTICYKRNGFGDAPGCVVVLNNNSWAGPEYIKVQTGWPNAWLHDYSGHMPNVRTDWNGWAILGGPKNVNGSGTAAGRPMDIRARRFQCMAARQPKGSKARFITIFFPQDPKEPLQCVFGALPTKRSGSTVYRVIAYGFPSRTRMAARSFLVASGLALRNARVSTPSPRTPLFQMHATR